MAKMWAHVNEPVPSLREVTPGLPERLDEVVARAMAKEPRERHLSAGDMARDAEAALRGELPDASERSVFRPRVRRRRVALIAAGAGAALALATIGFIALTRDGNGSSGARPNLTLAAVRLQVTRDHKTVRFVQSADLHGSGRKSYIVAVQDADAVAGNGKPVNDEVRVYDRRGDGLRLAFRFAPVRKGDPIASQFDLVSLADLDGDGSAELVGSYAGIPMVVVWSDRAQKYVIKPLIAEPPRLSQPRHVPAGWRRVTGADRTAVVVRDRTGGHPPIVGFSAPEFAILPAKQQLDKAPARVGMAWPVSCSRQAPSTCIVELAGRWVDLRAGRSLAGYGNCAGQPLRNRFVRTSELGNDNQLAATAIRRLCVGPAPALP